MIDQYLPLYKKLGYQFELADNLSLALTHRSASKQHNERLEFLGDAILGMVIANELYKRFPEQPEGNLTRMRASLVKGDTLAQLGQEFNLGDVLKLGPGELKSGGHRRASILADAIEAIIGAIYLEAGLPTCESLILSWFDSRIKKLDPSVHLKDDKTRLQEYLQGKGKALPVYTVSDIKGKSHEQVFSVACQVEGLTDTAIGQGSSRRKAEQKAASQMLQRLTNGN